MKLTDLARRLNDNTKVTRCDSCYLKVALSFPINTFNTVQLISIHIL